VYQSHDKLPDTCEYNEELIGLFLSTLPAGSFTVATKFFPALHEYKCDYDTLSTAVDGSLARLKLNTIDVYYLHRMPGSMDEMVEWMESMARVVKSGRVRHIGLSEAPGEWIRRAHRVHPVSCVQQEWSLIARVACETEVVPVCKELNIGIVAYSPLGRNILGRPREPPNDWRSDHPRWQQDNFEKNMRLVDRVAEVAQAKGLTAPQLSLVWLYQKAQDLGVACLPIPGTQKQEHALDNLGALAAPRLSGAEMEGLEALGMTVAGKRGNEEYMRTAVEGLSTVTYNACDA
jgi:aryl-alcohol dehydrogenase-like predicted oxidoreductase